jgi:hypothetical protein
VFVFVGEEEEEEEEQENLGRDGEEGDWVS